SAVFAGYGLSAGMAFRSESALGVAGGSLVLLGFAGNLFLPLSGVMLDIARFTPLYGVNALARYPLTGGHVADGVSDPLWLPGLNVVAWALILGVTAALLARRRRGRICRRRDRARPQRPRRAPRPPRRRGQQSAPGGTPPCWP